VSSVMSSSLAVRSLRDTAVVTRVDVVGLPVGKRLGVSDGCHVDGNGEGASEGERVGLEVGWGEGTCEGKGVGPTVGVSEGVAVGL